MDPLAKQLKEGIARKNQEQAQKEGKRLWEGDLARIAREKAPAEFEKLKELLRQRAGRINAEKPGEIPELCYVAVNPRVEAGKYAVTFYPRELYDAWEIDVRVGLHPNADQFMDEVPDVPTAAWHYRALADENGFFWLNTGTDTRSTPEQVVESSLQAFVKLLLADLRPSP